MKIGLIVAMDKEFKALAALLENKENISTRQGETCITGTLSNNTLMLMHSGIGKVNAALGAAEMIRTFHPQLIISSGCAGGADTALNVGDIIVSTSCQYHDVYCGPENLAGQVQGMPSEFQSPEWVVNTASRFGKAGKIATGDWFVDSPQKMSAIHATVPDAIAVDMESAAIAQTCHIYDTPFISFRVISDIPLKENNTAQYTDFWATMAQRSFASTKEFLQTISEDDATH